MILTANQIRVPNQGESNMGLISALKGVLQRKFDQESDIIGMVKAPERSSENSNNVNMYLWLTQQ
jgi:hypothetical protein